MGLKVLIHAPMLSRRVICAARVARPLQRPLQRPLFIRAFSEQKESPTQPFNHTEQKMTVDEATTDKRANVFTWGFLACLAIGFPAAIYVSDWAGITPKDNKPGPGSPLKKD